MMPLNHLSNSAVGLSGSVAPKPSTSAVANAYSSSQEVAPVNEQKLDTVNLSGKAMMLSRLFGSDGSIEPQYETTATTKNTSGLVYSFLTKGDREMLASAYEYASANGIDLHKVDNLAFDLGIYRRTGPGGPLDNAGNVFDSNGNPRIYEFNEQDEAIAQRVFTSKAMRDTLVDRGFLKTLFSPTKVPVHASDFAFLEKLVYAFSASGSDGATDPNAEPLVRYKPEDFPPLKMRHGQSVEVDREAVLSRLLGIDLGDKIGVMDLFSDDDQYMLSRLYAIALDRNEDLTKIDNLAMMLASYKMLGLLNKQGVF